MHLVAIILWLMLLKKYEELERKSIIFSFCSKLFHLTPFQESVKELKY